MAQQIDLYRVLGITATATQEQVQVAFRRCCKACHPDMGGTHAQMILVLEAWEILKDPDRRALYDKARSGANDPQAKVSWSTAQSQARASASATAQKYGRSWSEFSAWTDAVAADVQRHGAGRSAAGAFAGAIVGVLLGALIGWITGIGLGPGLAIGTPAGAVGGLIAVSRSRAKTSTTPAA
jgi:DnaJ-class molecular chaperone